MAKLEPCENCPFGGPRVHYGGRLDSPFVIVGDSPTIKECINQESLSGSIAEIVWKELPNHSPDDFLLLNAIRCKPPKKRKASATNKAVTSCRSYLGEILQQYPRKLILILGSSALLAVTRNSGLKVTKIRGSLVECSFTGAVVVPAMHPGALLRGTANYRQFKLDLQIFRDLLEENEVPPKKFVQAKTYVDMELPVRRLDKYVAADIETSGFDFWHHKILCVAMSGSSEEAFVYGPQRWQDLKGTLEDPNMRFIWHNGKFDIKFLRANGIHARVDEDTMLLSYALDESARVHDLETVMSDYLGAPNYKDMLDQYLPNKKASYEVIPKDILHKYAGIDGSGTYQAFKVLRRLVAKDPDLEKLYTQVLIPASECLARVETHGLYIDQESLRTTGEELENKIADLHNAMENVAHKSFNPNSPSQVAEILYDQLGHKRLKGNSTAEGVIAKLPEDDFIRLLKQYRKTHKLHSTYVKNVWSLLENEPNSRVHPNFLIHGTRTGRLACRHPNLQNIPRGPIIRGMYKAPEGKVLIEVDLNQAELRCLALLSGDKFLTEIYTDSARSLHHEVAVDFFGADYTHEQKMRAKAVNFGIVYGREAFSIAYEFDIPVREAQRYIDQWLNRASGAAAFIKKCRDAPLRGETLITPFGRKKRHQLVSGDNLRDLQNESSNFFHQSIASDITLMAGVGSQAHLESLGAHIVIMVHDSLIIECPEDPKVVDEVVRYTIEVMEGVAPKWGLTEIPFKAEAKVGKAWATLEDYKI